MKSHSKRLDCLKPQNWDRGTVLTVGMGLNMLAGVVLWCTATTFRGMSDWMLYAMNLLATLLLSLPAILSRKVWVQTIFMVLVDIGWICNIMYCRTYFTAIPLNSYLLVGNLTDFTASVVDSMRWGDILLPLITLAVTAWAYLTPKDRPWPRLLPYLGLTGAIALVCAAGLICRGGFYKSYDKLVQSCYYSTCGVPIYTIGGHLLYNAMSENATSSPETLAEIDRWIAEKEAVRPFETLPDTVTRRRNLVIILLESFESWPIEARVEGKEVTPYINSLIRRENTLYAPEMLTQVASGRSIDAQLLLGSGLLPMQNSVYSMRYPQQDYPSLMKAMKNDRQARSVILTCDKPITWNQEVIARSMGYDSLLHRSSWDIDELIGNPAKLSDGSFMRQSVEKLRKNELGIDGKPWLMTFVTYSGHNPFQLPKNLWDKDFSVPSDYPERLADYLRMAHYTDSKIKTLIDYLESRPDAKETLIVITGDHEGLAGDRAELLKSAIGRTLVSPEQFTPFIVLNSPAGGRINGTIGQIDMYPTLLDLLGLHRYPWKGMGQNILMPGRAAVAISSMTGKIMGDTTQVSAKAMQNIKSARRVSDMMISADAMNRKTQK